MKLTDPFIMENKGAIFLPPDYFQNVGAVMAKPDGTFDASFCGECLPQVGRWPERGVVADCQRPLPVNKQHDLF
jgi:hypothetical protein